MIKMVCGKKKVNSCKVCISGDSNVQIHQWLYYITYLSFQACFFLAAERSKGEIKQKPFKGWQGIWKSEANMIPYSPASAEAPSNKGAVCHNPWKKLQEKGLLGSPLTFWAPGDEKYFTFFHDGMWPHWDHVHKVDSASCNVLETLNKESCSYETHNDIIHKSACESHTPTAITYFY